MEFQGRIAKVLPMRSGTSMRTGNEWKAQPFVFEYFENPTDRYADSVVLETFDTNVMANIQEGMEVRCGFGHKVRTYQKDGKDLTINELRLYKIECIRKPAGNAAVTQQPTQQQGGQQQEGGDADDLPF